MVDAEGLHFSAFHLFSKCMNYSCMHILSIHEEKGKADSLLSYNPCSMVKVNSHHVCWYVLGQTLLTSVFLDKMPHTSKADYNA